MVKGPLTVTELIAFHAGGYGFTPYGLRASRLGYRNRQRIAPFFVKNEQGVYDVAQRVHWDDRSGPRRSGTRWPTTTGCMRQSWFFHQVSDWAGDDAVIERLERLDPEVQLHG